MMRFLLLLGCILAHWGLATSQVTLGKEDVGLGLANGTNLAARVMPAMIYFGVQTGTVRLETYKMQQEDREEFCQGLADYVQSGGVVPKTSLGLEARVGGKLILLPLKTSDRYVLCPGFHHTLVKAFSCMFFEHGVYILFLHHSPEFIGSNALYHLGHKFSNLKDKKDECGVFETDRSLLLDLYDQNETIDLLVDVHLSENIYAVTFDEIWVSIVFQYVLGLGFFYVAGLGAKYFYLRAIRGGSRRTHSNIFVILGLNIIVCSALGLYGFVGGFGFANGTLSVLVVDALRLLFPGVGAACDIMIVFVLQKVVRKTRQHLLTDHQTAERTSKWVSIFFRCIAYFGSCLDIGVTIMIAGNVISDIVGAVMTSATVFLFVQFMVTCYLTFYMMMVVNMLKKSLEGIDTSKVAARAQIKLTRKLIFWGRVSVVASVTQIIMFAFGASLILMYDSPYTFLFCNVLLIGARIVNSLAQVKFGEPINLDNRTFPGTGTTNKIGTASNQNTTNCDQDSSK